MGEPQTQTIHNLGGGDKKRVTFKTHGVERASLDEADAVWRHAVVTNEPTNTVNRACTFFRLSGGKWQYCVCFPTGATQILATEE